MHKAKRKNAMGKACSTYMRQAKCIQGFWWKNLKERDHLADPGLDEVVKMILKKRDGCVLHLSGAV
jgi:hypothetical protein